MPAVGRRADAPGGTDLSDYSKTVAVLTRTIPKRVFPIRPSSVLAGRRALKKLRLKPDRMRFVGLQPAAGTAVCGRVHAEKCVAVARRAGVKRAVAVESEALQASVAKRARAHVSSICTEDCSVGH